MKSWYKYFPSWDKDVSMVSIHVIVVFVLEVAMENVDGWYTSSLQSLSVIFKIMSPTPPFAFLTPPLHPPGFCGASGDFVRTNSSRSASVQILCSQVGFNFNQLFDQPLCLPKILRFPEEIETSGNRCVVGISSEKGQDFDTQRPWLISNDLLQPKTFKLCEVISLPLSSIWETWVTVLKLQVDSNLQ